jgi:hypothetical protein
MNPCKHCGSTEEPLSVENAGGFLLTMLICWGCCRTVSVPFGTDPATKWNKENPVDEPITAPTV